MNHACNGTDILEGWGDSGWEGWGLKGIRQALVKGHLSTAKYSFVCKGCALNVPVTKYYYGFEIIGSRIIC